jgi:hypothetical protein
MFSRKSLLKKNNILPVQLVSSGVWRSPKFNQVSANYGNIYFHR